MPPLRIFECMLPVCTFLDDPLGGGVTDSISEGKIEAPANLIDKIIHIAFMTAIIITGEKNSMVIVHEHPAGKVNRFYSGEKSVVVYVSGKIVGHQEYEFESQQADHTRFHIAEHTILI